MMQFSLKINGTPIKNPTDFGIEDYELTKSGRVASGKMTIDVIAPKLKFTLSYDVMTSTMFETIRVLLRSGAPFFTLTYVDNNVVKTARVYAGAIKRRRFREGSIWYWKSVTFDLIEQ